MSFGRFKAHHNYYKPMVCVPHDSYLPIPFFVLVWFVLCSAAVIIIVSQWKANEEVGRNSIRRIYPEKLTE